jgi:hypothetical protein
MEAAYERQMEAWMEQEREWYDMVDQLTGDGWHHGCLKRMPSQTEMTEIRKWLIEHYYGRHECHNDEVLLPTEKDLAWFMLRWS